ncbi:MAG: helix-turn-helix domain-containing protein [Lachnospiraceae bacterium]
MKLLMVNDEEFTVNTMKNEIPWQSFGISDVYIAYTVNEGKEIIARNQVDLLLCDIEMPEENGIGLIRWIRDKGLDIDCILLTCHADFNYAKEAVTLNCQDYLLLPTSYENIGNTVQKVVQRRTEFLKNKKLQEYGQSWLRKKEDNVNKDTDHVRTSKELVAECTSFILQNLNSDTLSVNEIAASFFINPIYLNRIFKKEKGIAISQFIIREKMSLAAELLKNPNSSGIAVAITVGYPNYSYFAHTFKKYFGCTPSQFSEQSKPSME